VLPAEHPRAQSVLFFIFISCFLILLILADSTQQVFNLQPSEAPGGRFQVQFEFLSRMDEFIKMARFLNFLISVKVTGLRSVGGQRA
jgi:hypothetical protein